MRFAVPATILAAVASPALAGIVPDQVDTFVDSSNDLFDNGLANLDITQVVVSQYDLGDEGIGVDIAITTRGMSDWTKYMLFLSGGGSTDGTASNPWQRPIDLGSNQIFGFIGSWIDGAGGNQLWVYSHSNDWQHFGSVDQMVEWDVATFHLGFVYSQAGAGQTLFFDVATSGGGSGDAGVDHLSRSDMAMGGWGQTSYAGEFLSFTIIPAPGAMGVMALAGVLGSRRRR